MTEQEDGSDPPPPTLSWEDKAREEQQRYLELLGTREYDSYRRRMPSICNLLLNGFCKCHEDDDGMCDNESEMVALRTKIGFALCGQPTTIPSEENCFTGYSGDKLKTISKVFDQIVNRQHRNTVLMGTIFISLEKMDGSDVLSIPIFRIPNPDIQEEYWFVDPSGRLYKNWNDFLQNNKLYKSKCCFPKDGVYGGDSEGKVEVDFGLTPASTLTGKVISYVDTAATVGSIAAGICMFFPPMALPSAAACGVVSFYSTVRGSMELADRSTHGQSLTDREAGRQWLSLAGTALGLGSAGGMAAVKIMTREGRVVSTIVTNFVTGLSVSSGVANGINILENAWTIKEQEEWLSLQGFQLAVSVLFFAHSLANFRTARSVVVETQTQVLNDHSAGLSRRQRNLFAGMQRDTLNVEPDPIIGRAKIIKDLNHISNKSEFFGQILKSNKQARKNDQPVQRFKFGNLVQGTQDGPINQAVQTSSPAQNVFLRQTTAFSPLEPTQFKNVSPRYLRPHEPALVTEIRGCLQGFSSCDIGVFLNLLNEVCERFKYGRLCMSAIRIVIDMYNCRNASEAMYILKNVMAFWDELVENYKDWRSRSRAPETESDNNECEDSGNLPLDVEEIMDEIVGDVDFIPEHFYHLGSIEMEEEVYHFPVDHLEWGAEGELAPEDYVLIAQNSFGTSTQSCNIMHQGNTANVFLEHHGLVKIISSVKQQIIILKKFKKLE
ncbi:uncharacterized protein LOC117645238 [Thrips palmi]|uniref:Uncharacterized protein LOC117645238 n=1 Tax=Thrips palmi TaxID=161013 RepID=A0A6P8YMJ6_THRPL|nr:uncharacterized protein LOC117645238 [Thrips palmi]